MRTNLTGCAPAREDTNVAMFADDRAQLETHMPNQFTTPPDSDQVPGANLVIARAITPG